MTDASRPMSDSGTRPVSARAAAYSRQTTIGVALATAIIGAWISVHVLTVFYVDLGRAPLLGVVVAVLLQTWLSVGLFIVAHDSMHGSLAPFRPAINRGFGSVALALYAGFSYGRLKPKHFDHHQHSGTDKDPDFDAENPDALLPWFLTFMRRHYGLREFIAQSVLASAYLFVFDVRFANLLVFWAAPAMISAFQLFYFGTYRPHRHEDEPFGDAHRARSEHFPDWLSLLTCFHFGHHHEHHDAPHVPWWRLPSYRRSEAALKEKTA